MAGICLRGKPGWGEVLAPLDTVINTFGGRWFDENWNAQLNSPEVTKAVQFYVNLVSNTANSVPPPRDSRNAPTCSVRVRRRCGTTRRRRSTVLESPRVPARWSARSATCQAPIGNKPDSGWLYTWSLAIPTAAKHTDAAWKFISWMTSKDYMKLVGDELGWERVPPGSRLSTYEIPEYAASAESSGP